MIDFRIGAVRTRSRDPVSMEWSMQEFNKFIKEFVKGTEYDAAAAVRYTSREVGIRIVRRTPVDTRRAVAGWSAAGRALNFPVPQSSASKSGDSGYEQHLTGSSPYIRFRNNVRYVIYLEYGWSRQAPLGMVRISMAEVRSSGVLPAMLSRSFEARWNNTSGFERYEAQESILTRGLPAVHSNVPTRRSVAARVAGQLRGRRAKHLSSGALSNLQKSLRRRGK
jgi:hypothetical protein